MPVESGSASKPATPNGKTSKGPSSQQRSYRPRPNEVPAQYINTFTTVLDYPKPRDGGDPVDPATAAAIAESARSRSQRQSKVDAIGKMDPKDIPNQSVAGSVNGGPAPSLPPNGISLLPPMANPANGNSASDAHNPAPEPNPNNNPLMKKFLVRPAPKLEKSSVKWSGPREPKDPSKAGERLFGLKECPTFYPTKEEFQDAMGYIRKIGEEGKGQDWGMVKIVPPKDWKMTFALNSEVSRRFAFERIQPGSLYSALLSVDGADVPISNQITTIELARGHVPGQVQLFGPAVHVSQTAG